MATAIGVFCMDGRTSPASVGVQDQQELVCYRHAGGMVPAEHMMRAAHDAGATLVVLTWHHSATEQHGHCAAHLGCARTARAKCLALGYQLRRRAPQLDIITARIDTDTGLLEFDEAWFHHTLMRAESSELIARIETANARHLLTIEHETWERNHSETEIYYGPAVGQAPIAHGAAFAVTSVSDESDRRALTMAHNMLAHSAQIVRVCVAVPLNGSLDAARVQALYHARTVRACLSNIDLRLCGVTAQRELVALPSE